MHSRSRGNDAVLFLSSAMDRPQVFVRQVKFLHTHAGKIYGTNRMAVTVESDHAESGIKTYPYSFTHSLLSPSHVSPHPQSSMQSKVAGAPADTRLMSGCKYCSQQFEKYQTKLGCLDALVIHVMPYLHLLLHRRILLHKDIRSFHPAGET